MQKITSDKIALKFKTSAYRVLSMLDFLCKVAVPPQKNMVCFASVPDFSENSFYLFMHMLRTRGKIHYVWLINEQHATQKIQDAFYKSCISGQSKISVLKKNSLSGYYYFLRCKIIFFTHGVYQFSRYAVGRDVVNLWHGMPIKCIGEMNNKSRNPFPQYPTKCIASSNFFRNIMAESFGIKKNEVLVCSQPRCDILNPENRFAIDRNKILAPLEVDDNKKMILWMPTYRSMHDDEGGLHSFMDDIDPLEMEKLEDKCEDLGLEVVIKLHPLDKLNKKLEKSLFKRFRIISSTEWEGKDLKLYDVLAVCDAIISDVSSVVIDFLITNKPIAIIGFNSDTYPRDLNFSLDLVLSCQNVYRLNDHNEGPEFFNAILNSSSGRGSKTSCNISLMFNGTHEDSGSEKILKNLSL